MPHQLFLLLPFRVDIDCLLATPSLHQLVSSFILPVHPLLILLFVNDPGTLLVLTGDIFILEDRKGK